MFAKIKTNFLTGLIMVVPVLVTFWFLYFIVDKLNLLLLEPIAEVFKNWVPAQNIIILTKIVIFFVLLLCLTAIGFATRILLLRNIFGFGEKILYKVPMISMIYRTIKEISLAFFVQKDTIFKKVVLIEYPRKGLYQLGFIMSDTKGEVQEKTKEVVVSVFLPTTPNPTSGMLVLVPEQDIIPLDMSVADGMKMIISGGAVVPKMEPSRRTNSSKETPLGRG